jgi:L-seryl-tRNA(Ser) seleniumtransferase
MSPAESLLRQLPSVDELLGRPALAARCRELPRALVADAVREALQATRAAIERDPRPELVALERLEQLAVEMLERWQQPSLRPVINATGVLLHTNLGRAPLGREAARRVAEAAVTYTTLEYDLEQGRRGRRDQHVAGLLGRLLGAEAALVVNNNAAAVFLVLHTLARDGEVVVSRGELIEIGEGFRIPDIMQASGARLREVGTTNRTRLADYEQAIGPATRLLLRVHHSNFRIVGFTGRPELEELVELGRRTGLPVYEDLGSGALVAPAGLEEPLATASLRAGVSLVSFSGDKLLGGPQAGIVAGRSDLVQRVRRNPLYRALRVDKMTIAALEETLRDYLLGRLDRIPVLQMMHIAPDVLRARAEALVAALEARLGSGLCAFAVVPGQSVVGGGSTPAQTLPTWVVRIRSRRDSAVVLERRLRTLAPPLLPVIVRIEDEQLALDLRTVFVDQQEALLASLVAALQ